MTKPIITPETYELLKRDRDYWRRRARRAEDQAQQVADEMAELRRQSHTIASRQSWGDAIRGW